MTTWRRTLGMAAVACGLAACDQAASSPVVDAAPQASAIVGPASATAPAMTSAAPPAEATPPTTVAAQHILVAYRGAKGAPKSVTRSKADAKKRAEEALAKVHAGEDFTSLVKVYSDDPAAADRLGSVGKFTRDKMDKAFSDAAFALKVDEVSGLVETPFGFHLIKRNQ